MDRTKKWVTHCGRQEKMSIQEVTKLYGLANWYGFQGNKQKAKELYAKILQSTSWPAFAYLASEMEFMEK